ncbi:MAG: DUF1768 domain-containing protein [Victivallales bacterium]|nr:DUF1768 domain-containing protein [Victivallales bacterium]
MLGQYNNHKPYSCAKAGRIVVMGGSFNPPTMAHFHLLKAAMDGIQAQKGIFVPVSKAYLKRKMRKAGGVQICFTEADRAKMLKCMAADDSRMEVSTIEFGTHKPRTFETMCDLHRLHPNAELYFLIGTDKFGMMSRMRPDNPFLTSLRFVVFGRDGEDVEKLIAENEALSRHQNQFVCLPAPKTVEGVSSTNVRELYLKGALPADALHSGVKKILESIPAGQFHSEISKFEGKYGFLSPYYPSSITVDNLTYRDAIAAFLAMLCVKREDKERLAKLPGEKAFQFGLNMVKIEGWKQRREEIMLTVQRLKFQQHPALATRLAATGKSTLTYGGQDLFWGEELYRCEGENRLGKILMEIRDKTRRDVK